MLAGVQPRKNHFERCDDFHRNSREEVKQSNGFDVDVSISKCDLLAQCYIALMSSFGHGQTLNGWSAIWASQAQESKN